MANLRQKRFTTLEAADAIDKVRKGKSRRQRCYVCKKLFSLKVIVEIEYSPAKGKIIKRKVCMPHSGQYKTGLEIEESY